VQVRAAHTCAALLANTSSTCEYSAMQHRISKRGSQYYRALLTTSQRQSCGKALHNCSTTTCRPQRS
jgi:hypothetical protein